MRISLFKLLIITCGKTSHLFLGRALIQNSLKQLQFNYYCTWNSIITAFVLNLFKSRIVFQLFKNKLEKAICFG
jgi:hypothetical protein